MPRLSFLFLSAALLTFGCSDTPETTPYGSRGPDLGASDAPSADAGANVDAVDASPDAGPTGPEVDLFPWCRLDAPLTRTGARFDDLRNGAGATRDGDPASGWLAPPLGGRLVADWQPWLGHSAVISRVTIDLENAGPATVRLLDGCGGALLWEEVGSGTSLEFDVPNVDSACFEAEIEDGRVLAVQIITTDEVEGPSPAITERDPIDILYPHFGVFEGYSGPLWSWSERDAVLRAHALHGLGTYVYAPAGDPLRSGGWHTPYPAEWLEEFRAFAERAVALEFEVTFGISPFTEWDEEDAPVLVEKLQSIADVGVSSFIVMADGVPPDRVDVSAAESHVAAVTAVRAWMDAEGLEGALHFLPAATTEAQRNLAADGAGYHEALTALPAGVSVIWSGAESWNAATTPSELEDLGATVGHDPIFLDSYWSGPSVRLGTYTGRDGVQAAAPVWVRAGDRPGIARFNLHQFAHWTQERPGGPEGARDFAAVVEDRWGLRELESPLDAELLNEIARAFDGAGPSEPSFSEYESAIDSVAADLDGGALSDRALRDALTMFAEMAAIRSWVWHSTLAIDLVDDLWLGLDYLRVEGQRSLWAMIALRELLGGRSPDDPIAEIELLEATLGALPAETSPDAFDRLWSAVQETTAAEEGPDELLFFEPPERCVAQAALGWRPFPDATWVTISGLPGATVEDDFVQWFASNAGTYRAVIAATAGIPTTWDFRIVDIVCEPEQG